MSPEPLARLEEVIGHRFENQALLEKALTHSSAGRPVNYQRLEFLGDRVLGIIVAEFLFRNFPRENEGDMARRFSALVDRSMCARVASAIELGGYVFLSDGEKAAGGAQNENIMADVVEALIAAAYLDSGLPAAEKIVLRLWGDNLYEMVRPPVDPKTELQEWTQARGLGLPSYELVGRTGPDHAPVFDVCVHVEDHASVLAQGTSRRAAEKNAAALLLRQLKKVEMR